MRITEFLSGDVFGLGWSAALVLLGLGGVFVGLDCSAVWGFLRGNPWSGLRGTCVGDLDVFSESSSFLMSSTSPMRAASLSFIVRADSSFNYKGNFINCTNTSESIKIETYIFYALNLIKSPQHFTEKYLARNS